MSRIIKRTNSDDPDFNRLANELELDLKNRDGVNHAFYTALNRIDKLNHVVVIYHNDTAVGCGGLRPYTSDKMEIKRMYVAQSYRRLGIATIILNELEKWSAELKYVCCVLETGKNQPEAIAFYRKNNFYLISNFGKYTNSENSICFEKTL